MNWTSRTPIEGVKCLVETTYECTFPAHFINGAWWNTEKGFPIDGVKRWIIYPEGEEPNDYIAPEVLLKYLMKAYRSDHAKLEAIRKLNNKLCSAFNSVNVENEKLKNQNRRLKEELKASREQSKRLKNLFDRMGKLFVKAATIDATEENQMNEEFVA